ncbi:MAG: lipopolysaccharide biosynthesis protein, partial [Bacteroidaceae bacterium]|nr:lipopolysaccharide biosynthesis protein [Bacteroidaceae bacterium]
MANNLKQRTAKNLFWSGFSSVLTQLLNLAFGIVLAQQLSPNDYGMVGVLTVFTVVAGALQESGFIAAITNLEKATPRHYNAVFWFSALVSLAIYALLFVSAPLIADFFGQPELKSLSRLVFVSAVLAGIGTSFAAYMFRELMNREKALISILALLCSGTVGIVMAYSGYGYWSLAWQQIVYIGLSVAMRIYCVPWRPSFRIDFTPVREMFGFSSKLLVTSIINGVSGNILSLVFGKIFAGQMHLVGHFTQANKWNLMAANMVGDTVKPVAQPMLSIITGDKAGQRRAFRKMLRFTSLVCFPAMIGLCSVSQEFILVTIGQKWAPCVPLLRWLCIGGAFLPLHALYQQMTIACGKSGLYMRMNVALIVLQIGAVVATARFGMETMVSVYALLNVVWFFVWHAVSAQLLSLRFVDMLRDTLPFALAAAVPILAVYGCTMGISSLWLRLGVRVVVVAAAYFAILYVAHAEILREALRFVRR